MSNLLSCQQIKLMLDAYHDGELSESERAETERHLAGCVSCQNDAGAIATVAKSLKELPVLAPKMDVAANIDQLIAARSKPSLSKVSRPIVWSAVGIAAAAAVVLFVGKVGAPVQTTDVAVRPPLPAPLNSGAHQQEVAVMPQKNQDAMPTKPGIKIASHNVPKNELAVKPELSSSNNANHKTANLIAQRPAAVEPDMVARKGKATDKQSGTAGNTTVVAVAPKQNDADAVDRSNNSLIAVYDADQHNSVTEELGITTNEDGLYAIKL